MTMHLMRKCPCPVWVIKPTRNLQQKKVDLVVMGTVSRVGISGLLIGNTAERVLSSINASVLTVKPDGFKTPVK
jgi:nucleotide-binding universal stress UspA family protein